jgi:hypothetical protein
MNNGQYLLAQFGSPAQRKFSESLLLEASELPGRGWSKHDEKTWRAGKFGPSSDAVLRAKHSGAYNAIRTFGQSATSRAVLTEVRPMATASDAEAELAVSHLHLQLTPNKKAATLTDAVTVEKTEQERPSSTIQYERFAIGEDQRVSYRYIVGNLDRVVYVVTCCALDDGWPWDEVTSVSQLQADRIQSHLKVST